MQVPAGSLHPWLHLPENALPSGRVTISCDLLAPFRSPGGGGVLVRSTHTRKHDDGERRAPLQAAAPTSHLIRYRIVPTWRFLWV